MIIATDICNWTISWGDVPTWIGAVGTLSAVFWAVFLFRRKILDTERAQARLLAPVGGAVPVQVLPGELMKDESTAAFGVIDISTGIPIIASEAFYATIKLVSTSDEAFSDLVVDLIMEDGKETKFVIGFSEMAPHETKVYTNYYPPGVISGKLLVRLRFRDANGRYWERINGEPVRAIR